MMNLNDLSKAAKILKHLPYSTNGDEILLVEFSSQEENAAGNIFLADRNGTIKSRFSPSRSGDSFTDMQLEGNYLSANTWNCYSETIDLLQKRIIKTVFTK